MEIIETAFDIYKAALKRRANSETNAEIKRIRENEVRTAENVLNKLRDLT